MKKDITTLDQLKDEHYGKVGTAERNEFDAGYKNFRIGVMIHEAMIQKGLTEEELAEKSGTTKSYISKIENDGNELTLKKLFDIVEKGLGGKVKVEIEF